MRILFKTNEDHQKRCRRRFGENRCLDGLQRRYHQSMVREIWHSRQWLRQPNFLWHRWKTCMDPRWDFCEWRTVTNQSPPKRHLETRKISHLLVAFQQIKKINISIKNIINIGFLYKKRGKSPNLKCSEYMIPEQNQTNQKV